MNEKLKKYGKYAGAFCLALVICALPAFFAGAADIKKYLTETGLSNDLGSGDLAPMIGKFINIVLSILGLLLVLLILWAGFLWMTSSGKEDNVKKAKTMITQAVVGLLIIFASYAIANFVIDQLTEVTGQ